MDRKPPSRGLGKLRAKVEIASRSGRTKASRERGEIAPQTRKETRDSPRRLENEILPGFHLEKLQGDQPTDFNSNNDIHEANKKKSYYDNNLTYFNEMPPTKVVCILLNSIRYSTQLQESLI
ncbi:hypothetical protein EAI_03445 [Harpegnathos saltator]|uniref:Uncharacterized protein n=1 Tax=Harpegnathos saltator TaxID=610380 RepID=E2BI33_HARSA|nr:hypothetical protein EAI_03445 [Harpegnathos saltator]